MRSLVQSKFCFGNVTEIQSSSFCAFLALFALFIVLTFHAVPGSMIEQEIPATSDPAAAVSTLAQQHSSSSPSRRRFITSALIDDRGAVRIRYRKQRLTRSGGGGSGGTNSFLSAGDASSAADCGPRLGKVSLLICLDVDHADVVASTLQLAPTLIINPAFICGAPLSSSSLSSSSSASNAASNVASSPTSSAAFPQTLPAYSLASSTWRVAQQTKAYQLEYLAVQHAVDFVRYAQRTVIHVLLHANPYRCRSMTCFMLRLIFFPHRVDASSNAGAMGISTIVTADFTRFLCSPAEHATMVFLQQPHPSRLNSLTADSAASSALNSSLSSSLSSSSSSSSRFVNSFNRCMRAADGARSRPHDNVGSRYHVQPLQLLDPCRSLSSSSPGASADAATRAVGSADARKQMLIRGWVATDDVVVLLCEV